MRFKIDWASLVAGWKFTVFALFYFVFEGNFQVPSLGGLYLEGGGGAGDLTEGFLRYQFWGLIYMDGLIFAILRYTRQGSSDNIITR